MIINKAWFFFCIGLLFLNSCVKQKEGRLTDFVNPFLGTAPLEDPDIIGYTPPEGWRVWAGLVFPGAAQPNAMVQVSPVTKYHSGSGYHYEDTLIRGFTHTNKGHWNLNHIPVLPASGQISASDFSSGFDKEREFAEPGYYQVFLNRYKVNVELTSTLRSALHRYKFERGKEKKLIVDLESSNENVQSWGINQLSDCSFSGYQVTGDTVFFYAETDSNIEKIDSLKGDNRIVPVLSFAGEASEINLKIGLSFVSQKNAQKNVEHEIGNKSFDEIKKESSDNWEKLLSRITVSGGTQKQKELFYSSFYRSFLWPALRSDSDGTFRNKVGKIVRKDFNYYTTPALWDTYRNKLVLLGIVSPEVTSDVIKSLIDKGEQTGFIPTFFHGDHAAPFIAGSYLRGIRDFDMEKAYRLLLRNAQEEGGVRPYISEYIRAGFISTPEIDSAHVETKAKAGVAKTLEYAFDDYAVAQLAKEMKDSLNYGKFLARSKNYVNVFDTTTNFMRGRYKNREWVKDFNPEYPYYEYMYREANAWQLSFFVPHDMPSLVELYGGKEAFEKKLDTFFTKPWNSNYIARNVSSFIGQYSVGNQPDHEAPFSYYFVDKPEKSQIILDSIMNNFYGIGEHELALPGMDDAGEMSAWYVFGALGLYPYSSADARYIVSIPLFDEILWRTDTGDLKIIHNGSGHQLRGIKINGKKISGYFVPHSIFQNKKTMEIETE